MRMPNTASLDKPVTDGDLTEREHCYNSEQRADVLDKE